MRVVLNEMFLYEQGGVGWVNGLLVYGAQRRVTVECATELLAKRGFRERPNPVAGCELGFDGLREEVSVGQQGFII
jgi:hypothetical protein